MYLADNYNKEAIKHNEQHPDEEEWVIIEDTKKLQGVRARSACLAQVIANREFD